MKIPALFRTSAFQLTLIYMLLFSLSVVALFAFVYWSTVGYLERQTTAIIEAEIGGLAEQFERRGLDGLIDVVAERVRRDPEGRSFYLFADASLRPLAGNLSHWPRGLPDAGGWVDFEETEDGAPPVPVRARILRVGPQLHLLVGRDIRELDHITQVFRRALLLGSSVTLGLSLVGGLLMSLSALRRISNINRTTRRIIAGDLSQRVPVTGSWDEHDELARNVNVMLDQIENLLAGVRHVADSVAHDLKGPLTRLRNRLEILAAQEAPDRRGLAECVEQADGLLATFNALLRIARVESGAYRSAFEKVEVGRIVHDICDLYRAAADERQIELRCESATTVTVFGDRELLAQALTNLLDNALKYTSGPGRVDVRLEQTGTRMRLRVTDSGPGIPASERERVLERFSRLDAARSKPGNGLGLAMVKAIAEQHDGRLRFEDNAPHGLVAILELPVAQTSEPAR
jgi:signal transduction histidine kinase